MVVFENLSAVPLVLELSASQSEDVELFLKGEDHQQQQQREQGNQNHHPLALIHSTTSMNDSSADANANANADDTSNIHQSDQAHGPLPRWTTAPHATARARALERGRYAPDHDLVLGSAISRIVSPSNGNGELKERFMETMRELSTKTEMQPHQHQKSKLKGGGGKERGKSTTRAGGESNGGGAVPGTAGAGLSGVAGSGAPKQSVGASVAAALKKGGRGRPVQVSPFSLSSVLIGRGK